MSKGFSVRFRKGTETKISGAKITGTVLTTIGLIIRAITVGLGIVPTTTAGPFTLSAVRDIGSGVSGGRDNFGLQVSAMCEGITIADSKSLFFKLLQELFVYKGT